MLELIKTRVFRTVKKYSLVENGDKICVALSGGKDSVCALFLLNEYIAKENLSCKIKALHLDFGFRGFEKAKKVCEEQAKLTGVEFKIIDVRELGIDIERIAQVKKRAICSVCGVVKRYLLNKLARELGCNKLATGHNMDDFLVFFFKNLLSKNYFWISKFKPKTESSHKKVVCRIRPLIFIGNKETEFLCREKGIPFLTSSCPYAQTNAIKRKREKWYKLLYSFENLQKDFRYTLAQSVVEMSKFFEKENKMEEFKECKLCGEPTNQEICGFCKLTKQI